MSRLALLGLAVGSLLFGGLSVLPLSASIEAENENDAWLTMELLPIEATALAEWQAARHESLSKLPGFGGAHAFTPIGDEKRAVAVSLWSSIEAREDAALALDGSESVTPASQLHFRRLRSSDYDSKTPTGHLEVVVHRTKAGTTREANLALYDKAEADFAKGEGLLGHSLWISPNGQWLHLLHWRSAQAFEETGKAFMRTPGVGAWIRSLDFRRFQMLRGDVTPPPKSESR